MNIHEYQAKTILSNLGVNVPKGHLIEHREEIEKVLRRVESDRAVIKAQVHAGGRGKAGGVKLVSTMSEAIETANKMLGMRLITHQTSSEGIVVNKLYVEEATVIERELYMAFVLNRETSMVSLMVSPDGGMDIEEVAQKTPERIMSISIDPIIGLKGYEVRRLGKFLSLNQEALMDFNALIEKLYTYYWDHHCSMIEINPLVINNENRLCVLDAKMNFDANALGMMDEIYALRDVTQEDEKEVEASKHSLAYITLDGEIGCMVNGAGLAMATVDAISYAGGNAANFLDVGGSASVESVSKAFEILISDKKVRGVFINIFGGIMKCDVIAQGIVNVAKEQHLTMPIVVRLEGSNVDEGKKILDESGLNIISTDSLDEGALAIVNEVGKAGQ